jgi:hypothetical protein
MLFFFSISFIIPVAQQNTKENIKICLIKNEIEIRKTDVTE